MRPPNVGSMLGHRLRRWPNIEPTLGGRLDLAGMVVGLFTTNRDNKPKVTDRKIQLSQLSVKEGSADIDNMSAILTSLDIVSEQKAGLSGIQMHNRKCLSSSCLFILITFN